MEEAMRREQGGSKSRPLGTRIVVGGG
jgi:hypothetical protein